MDILNDCKQKIIDAYEQSLKMIEEQHLHILYSNWKEYSKADTFKYTTLDEYIHANSDFSHYNGNNEVGWCILYLVKQDGIACIVTDDELNDERKKFQSQREETIKEYGSSTKELLKKLHIAAEKKDKAFDEWRKLNIMVRGY